MMQESRRRVKERREKIKKLLAESRSGSLPLMEDPHLESIPGLIQDLNDFIQSDSAQMSQSCFDAKPGFDLNNYRDHILSILSWDCMLFSDISPIIEDCRLDKIWRFITLIFMHNDREVELTQYGNDLLVQKVYHEAD